MQEADIESHKLFNLIEEIEIETKYFEQKLSDIQLLD